MAKTNTKKKQLAPKPLLTKPHKVKVAKVKSSDKELLDTIRNDLFHVQAAGINLTVKSSQKKKAQPIDELDELNGANLEGLKVIRQKQEIKQRKKLFNFLKNIYLFSWISILVVFFLVGLKYTPDKSALWNFPLGFELSETSLNLFIVGTIAKISVLIFVIVKNLYPSSNNKKTHLPTHT